MEDEQYTEEDKRNAQMLRILLVVYKQGWKDAVAYLTVKKNTEFNSIDKTLELLNKVPPPKGH